MPDQQDLTAVNQKLLAETRADLLKRQLSNSENYDKAVISLSTAFLGLSLAFLKDLVPIQRAEWLWLLYGSWLALAGEHAVEPVLPSSQHRKLAHHGYGA